MPPIVVRAPIPPPIPPRISPKPLAPPPIVAPRPVLCPSDYFFDFAARKCVPYTVEAVPKPMKPMPSPRPAPDKKAVPLAPEAPIAPLAPQAPAAPQAPVSTVLRPSMRVVPSQRQTVSSNDALLSAIRARPALNPVSKAEAKQVEDCDDIEDDDEWKACQIRACQSYTYPFKSGLAYMPDVASCIRLRGSRR
jgi:hypothetical protein